MKTSSLTRIALFAGALSVAGLTAAIADDNNESVPPPMHHGHHGEGMLTPEEQDTLQKDREAVMAADPDLKTEEKKLREQMHQFQDKMDAAIIKQDPNAAPIIAKIKASGHHGPPPEDK